MAKYLVIIASIIAALGVAYGAYERTKQKILRSLKECRNMNVQFITNWISSQDMPEYTSEYTAVYLRGKELPLYSKLKRFVDVDSVVCLSIFDKKNNRSISSTYYVCANIDRELGDEEFIEFPFEA